MIVAVQPDDYGGGDSSRPDASSPRWEALLTGAGVAVRRVDVYSNDILSQLQSCRGFMWRHGHHTRMRQLARRLLPVVEYQLGLVTYPDQRTCWHYDDKVAQRYLLEAADLPAPRTWIFWDESAALAWARRATYPIVLKLSSGAASQQVTLVHAFDDASGWIQRLFQDGVFNLDLERAATPAPLFWDLHRHYVLFQEFLPGNAHDTRVTVIGRRAFGYRRFNRPGDFRASGSGLTDYDPTAVDSAAIRLAFRAAHELGTQSLAFDVLRQEDGRPVIAEVSYTYVSWMIHECPGHWELRGKPGTGELAWCEGPMWPEEAQVTDFLGRLRHG